jgi:hypothetical protein
VEIHEVKKKKK